MTQPDESRTDTGAPPSDETTDTGRDTGSGDGGTLGTPDDLAPAGDQDDDEFVVSGGGVADPGEDRVD